MPNSRSKQASGMTDKTEHPPRFLTPTMRLREMLARPGGTTRDQAIRRAQANLDALRPEAFAGIKATISVLSNMADQCEGPFVASPIAASLLSHAESIQGMAALYRLESLDRAATLFCELLRPGSAPCTVAAVMVFVRSLMLFATPEDTGGANILHQLNYLVQHQAQNPSETLGV
jgi:hypothetical protein